MEAQDSDMTMVEEPRGFKRPRSPSSDLSDEPLAIKVAKHSAESILGQAKRALSSSSDENLNDRASKRVKGSETDDPLSANNSIELGDATVYNLKLISVDEDGDEIHLQPVTPTKSSNGQSILKDGLPTPQPTPMPKAGDPFDKASLPVPVGKSVTAHDSPANFAYMGDMKLFGLFPSKVYFYQHVSDELHPYDEVVKISSAERLSLANLLPSLKGSDWDAIALEDPILGYQEEQLIGASAIGRRRGLYFESDVVFQGTLQPVSDFLRDFFHQDKPAIRLSTWLSEGRQYGKLEAPSSFVLRGSLQHMSLDLLDILKFREIGVELSGHQIYHTAARDTKWSFGYGFFGKLDLSVPCTVVPLQVEYYLLKSVNSWMLRVRLTDDEWNDVFGIKGLQLSEVLLQAKIDVGKEKDSRLSFGVEANLQLRKTTFGIRGYYSKDYYSVEAYLGDLSLQDVGEIFHELIGCELDIFSHDFVFKNMSLRLSSEGIQLLGAVTINGHTSARGALGLWRDGISISGGIGDLEFEHINIKEASFDVFIASKLDTACSRISKLDITGDVCFCGVELKVALHTETCPKEGDLMWTIYGEVQGDVTTSKLVPEPEGTFLDISLNRLVLLASNHDMPAGSYKGINYPVAKGFQFCAGIDSIPELEHLMRGSVKGMVLRASYSSGQLGIGILLPAERTISFSNTVYSGPLEIEVQAGKNTALILKALLNVKVDTQPDPLQFSLGLKADKVAASAYAQMLNDWTNPCNLGEKVVIRKCALEFGIVYTTFFTTGTPGVIGLAGELAIGSKLAGVAMKVSQNPSEQLLCAQIKDLGVVDLVQFASLVADHEFPTPDNFIHFNDVELYLSTGTTVGLTAYPPGASLKGDMTLFGKHAKFECTVGSMVKVMASIEPFNVGPLTVKGVSQPDAIVDIEISKDTQHVLIDGAVEVWGAMASLHLEAAFYPKRLLDFALALQLSDLFKLKLEAKLTGEVNIKDFKSWANADFEVYGLMEQHVIDHVVGQLEQQIDAAKEATRHGFDEVKKRMEEKEAAFKASCQEAIDELEVARADWHKKKANIDAAFNSAHEEAARIRREL
ncbi:hypothetical protein FALBO_11375 [Fusarium albosuccineum]|uniref:Uncharacterized protein n=1 Tax=Fusarium albosuccineum TaxID=1237068 RepID=A0A8H4PA51_9HYPO|nr:hypothetical protein FALBO_11375 [Fusarium albosuccineum]